MTESNKKEDDLSSINIFRITDELVYQVDKTKKMIVIMILAIFIAVPASWHAAPLLTGNPDSFRLVGYVTILIALLFLALGLRQWFVLSKWTGRYKAYKELQKRVDEKLDFESPNGTD